MLQGNGISSITRNLQLVTPIDDDNGGTRDVEMAEPTAVGTGFGGGISSFCSKTFFCGQEANVSEETGIDHVDFDKLFDLTHPHPSIDLKRMEIIKQKLQELDDDEEKKRKIIIMKYATDPYFFDDDSPDEIWEAFQRLEAWEDYTGKMVFTTVLQCFLSGICLVGTNEPITIGTAVTTISYFIGLIVFNPTKNTDRVIDKVTEQLEMVSSHCYGYGAHIAFIFLWPFILLAIVMGLACDIALEDDVSSWYQFWDIFTGIFLRLTALSVGLRSYNPLYALGTFIGFEFIEEFDEKVMTMVEVDLTKTFVICKDSPAQVEKKLFHLQVATYISMLAFYVLVIYYTVHNQCYLFCYEPGSPLQKLTGITGLG